MDYFDHPYISNSKLSAFGAELGILPSFEASEEKRLEAFRFGTLFDLYETEPERIDYLNGKLIGTDYRFYQKDISKVKIMSKHLRQSTVYNRLLSLNPDFQKEIYKENFTLDNVNFINFKAKLDLFLPGLVIDLKTTDCTSQNQFENTCEMFGYFRQMLFYMALTESKKSVLIGVSKINYKVFTVHFSENHPKYQETMETCRMLIFKYLFLS